MVTIRELGEKYGGIISEFVARCDEEGLDCETEKSNSEMFNTLISSLKEGKLLTEKQAMYSCSKKLYIEAKEKAEEDFKRNMGKIGIFSLVNKAFQYACSNGFLVLAKMILSRSSLVNVRANKDWTFRSACENGHLEVAKWLLEIRPDINTRYSNDYIFRSACRKGYLEMAKWFLEIEPNIDIRANGDGAFRYACRNGHLEILKWLLSIRPDIDVRTKDDYPLFVTYRNRHLKICKWLLKVRPDIANDIDHNMYLSIVLVRDDD